MKYGLKNPCPECPFRNDIPPVSAEVAASHLMAIDDAGEFPCHHFADLISGFRITRQDSQQCAGAMILYAKETRDAVGSLNLKAPVYADFSDMMAVCK